MLTALVTAIVVGVITGVSQFAAKRALETRLQDMKREMLQKASDTHLASLATLEEARTARVMLEPAIAQLPKKRSKRA